jgi:hypothetical protein
MLNPSHENCFFTFCTYLLFTPPTMKPFTLKPKRHRSRSSRRRQDRTPRGRAQSCQADARILDLSCHQALSIFEIFEAIVERVDMRTILISVQQVCTAWRNMVLKSRRIQKALFFYPNGEAYKGMESPRTTNPLLWKSFEPLFKIPYAPMYYGGEWHYEPPGTLQIDASTLIASGLGMGDAKDHRRRHLAFTRKGASWRQMLISQPPPTRICHVRQSTPVADGETYMERNILAFPRGLRMGEYYDFIYAALWGDHHKVAAMSWANVNWDYFTSMMDQYRADPIPATSNADIKITQVFSAKGVHRCGCHHNVGRDKGFCYRNYEAKLRERHIRSVKWMYLCEEFAHDRHIA